MAFLETPRFPDCIAQGSAFNPAYSTNVQDLTSGYEARNANWLYPRYSYDVAPGVKRINDLEDVLDFFHVSSGKAHGFRFKDFLDYKSARTEVAITMLDQNIGTGDGAEVNFQLVKRYVVGSSEKVRKIVKPVDGTLLVAVAGVVTTAFTMDYTTGVITFDVAPTGGQAVTAGYEFDVPVRFDSDQINFNLEIFNAGGVAIPLVELKL